MEFSKLKVEVYDFLAVIIPGLLVACEIAVTIWGWATVSAQLTKLSAGGFTLLTLFSFAFGTVLQELADSRIKAWKGDRFFKSGRDRLWNSKTGQQIRAKIASEIGHELENADATFDYCLTRIGARFGKRDLFLATSDLSRSLVVACCFAVCPITRLALVLPIPVWGRAVVWSACMLALIYIGSLCWTRMVRFRALSETPVFHTFLATPPANMSEPLRTQ